MEDRKPTREEIALQFLSSVASSGEGISFEVRLGEIASSKILTLAFRAADAFIQERDKQA